MEVSMTFISQPMTDHKEKEAVPEGRYTLRIADYKVRYLDNGQPKNIMVVMEIDGELDAKPVMFFYNLTTPDMDPDKKYWYLAFQKGFLRKFGLEWSDEGVDPDDWLGATAEMNLIQETDERTGEVRNAPADREIPPVT
jgi:hypothetical protein